MNLNQMESFRAVMLTGSVSQAAKQLYRTQPAVSMVISSLEKQIGFQLFERRKKRLYPTPEANYLYAEIEAIFSRINDVSQTLQDIQNKQYGFLRIGCMPGPSNFFVPDLVADFLEEHPKIQASLQTRTSEGVREWVASDQYDIGLTELTERDSAIDKEVFSLSCLCALPADHPLAVHEVITPEHLDDEPMITLHPDHSTYYALQQLFESSGYRMNVRLQTRFFIPALRFIERGLGVCIMDPISAASYCSYAQPGKVVFRRFDSDVCLKLGIIYPANKPRSLITQDFADQLRERIQALDEHPQALFAWGKDDKS
ncbi:LysR family transcriptional regulator [Aliamphritea hakodatensis]|uniref:LysR family transcriptional regulator n=1 Tax=Aliamphritea hakodatensis TaxID=2895352 RepID=UPI0022FDA2C9|nr:LysR substrate-binding domain-containing protein [Aliamphritea hakodatensis]